MAARDIKDFFREIKESEVYKDIDSDDLEDFQDQLSDITIQVEKFVLERFLETFPCADPIIRESAKGLPYYKAYTMLTEYSEMPGKRRSVRNLMRDVIAASEKNLPVWYKEEGKRYFEASHISRLLEIL